MVQTTFEKDFTIAETFGEKEIEDTARRIFEEVKHYWDALADFTIFLNDRSWDLEDTNENYSRLYEKLYYKYDQEAVRWAAEHFTRQENDLFYDKIRY